MRTSWLKRDCRRGFSLVEVTLALGVAGFCLVTVMGLIPLGLNSNQNSLEQTLAASVASQVFSDLRLAPKSGKPPVSPCYKITVPAPSASGTTAITSPATPLYTTADGSPTVSSSNIERFQVNVSFITPPLPAGGVQGLPPGQSTMVRVLVTWPPLTAPANATGAFEVMGALDRG